MNQIQKNCRKLLQLRLSFLLPAVERSGPLMSFDSQWASSDLGIRSPCGSNGGPPMDCFFVGCEKLSHHNFSTTWHLSLSEDYRVSIAIYCNIFQWQGVYSMNSDKSINATWWLMKGQQRTSQPPRMAYVDCGGDFWPIRSDILRLYFFEYMTW